MPKFRVWLQGRRSVYGTIVVDRQYREEAHASMLSDSELAEVDWQTDYGYAVDNIEATSIDLMGVDSEDDEEEDENDD